MIESEGITSFKTFMAYKGALMIDDRQMTALMQEVRHDGIKVTHLMPGSVSAHFNGHTPGPEDAWKIQPRDIARIVLDLLAQDPRTLASSVEIRPSKPPKKS